MKESKLRELRKQVSEVNHEILDLLSKRAELVVRIGEIKHDRSMETYDPEREAQQLSELTAVNKGPFSNSTIKNIFSEIFRASLNLLHHKREQILKVSRSFHDTDTIWEIAGVTIGATPQIIAGPCAIESERQINQVAEHLAKHGVKILRGGAHKPRTSPYSFQGLGKEGYKLLGKAAKENGMISVSEIMDENGLQEAADHIDIFQIGARNMANFKLLEAARTAGKPILLKRGIAATYEEFLLAAEYIIADMENIILCERGIRTFEPWTRNTLDISAVPILRKMSHLPVCVDISHAGGRTDIIPSLARASLACGANLVMVEVHPTPAFALSDPQQQIDLNQFDLLMEDIKDLLDPNGA